MDEVIYGSMAWDLDGNKLVPKYVVGVSMPDTQKAPASGTVMDPKAGYNEDGSIKEGYRFSYNYHGRRHSHPPDGQDQSDGRYDSS